jgi:hypothetical protein
MAGTGGARPGAGRKPGIPNKATGEVKLLAAKHGPAVLKELARLAVGAESEQARVAACNAILDRAYGKATQPIAGDDDMPAIRAALKVAFVGVDR